MSLSDADNRARPRTRTEDLRLTLADEIMRGEIAPGTPLDEMRIAARFSVSRTPVREALRQLAASGLVEIRPHRGAVATQLTGERLEEMFVAMAELEGICAGLAAISMTAAERRALADIQSILAEIVRSGDPQRYHEINESFHAAIYFGAHNGPLAEMTLATRTRLQPFRRAQFRTLGRLAKSLAEHQKIIDAIERGDREGATTAMRDHIGTVKQAYENYAGLGDTA